MKRDLDLIRALLFEAEKLGLDDDVDAREIRLPPWTTEQIIYHLRLLDQTGLVETIDTSTMSGRSCILRGLLPPGHDYLDTVRNETIWIQIKNRLADQGVSATLDIAKSLGTSLIAKALGLG